MTNISVIGAGAWGTALAQCYASAGHNVLLWVREPDLARTMERERCNTKYFPDIRLHENIEATNDLSKAAQQNILLNVVPAQHLRENLKALSPLMMESRPLIICAKGIEISTHKLLTEIVAEECPMAKPAILTGPNFAKDIANGLPSASTLASDKETGKYLLENLTAKNLRLYFSDDMIGAQIAGAIKNVIAIACGICHGLNLGESARAALVTRGLAEIARLTDSMKGKRETLMGQCGVGDMMLTCSSMQSRNFSCGVALASGKTLDQIMAERSSVTEGVTTAKAAYDLARAHNVDMPIVSAIYRCLYEGLPIREALGEILNRPQREEKE